MKYQVTFEFETETPLNYPRSTIEDVLYREFRNAKEIKIVIK